MRPLNAVKFYDRHAEGPQKEKTPYDLSQPYGACKKPITRIIIPLRQELP